MSRSRLAITKIWEGLGLGLERLNLDLDLGLRPEIKVSVSRKIWKVSVSVSSRTQNQKSRSRLGLGPQRIVGISVYLPIWSYQSTQHVQTTVALYVCIFCTSISNCLIPV